MLLNSSRAPTGGAPVENQVHSLSVTAHIKAQIFHQLPSKSPKKQKWDYAAAREPIDLLFVMAHIKILINNDNNNL